MLDESVVHSNISMYIYKLFFSQPFNFNNVIIFVSSKQAYKLSFTLVGKIQTNYLPAGHDHPD